MIIIIKKAEFQEEKREVVSGLLGKMASAQGMVKDVNPCGTSFFQQELLNQGVVPFCNLHGTDKLE